MPMFAIYYTIDVIEYVVPNASGNAELFDSVHAAIGFLSAQHMMFTDAVQIRIGQYSPAIDVDPQD